jgi:hypothetical protein
MVAPLQPQWKPLVPGHVPGRRRVRVLIDAVAADELEHLGEGRVIGHVLAVAAPGGTEHVRHVGDGIAQWHHRLARGKVAVRDQRLYLRRQGRCRFARIGGRRQHHCSTRARIHGRSLDLKGKIGRRIEILLARAMGASAGVCIGALRQRGPGRRAGNDNKGVAFPSRQGDAIERKRLPSLSGSLRQPTPFARDRAVRTTGPHTAEQNHVMGAVAVARRHPDRDRLQIQAAFRCETLPDSPPDRDLPVASVRAGRQQGLRLCRRQGQNRAAAA